MITIRIYDEDNLIVVLDPDTAIDSNDCCEITADFDSLTIQDCLNYYKDMIKRKGDN